MPASARQRGFTVAEMLITLVLLAVVLTGVFQASERGMSLFRTTSVQGDVNGRTARLAARITKELLAADEASLMPNLVPPAVGPDMGSDSLEFRAAESFAGGLVLLSAPRRIAWEVETGELENDLDDDGDGLVDEGQVVLTLDVGLPEERRVVLASGVRGRLEGSPPNAVDDDGNGLTDERGLCFTRQGDAIVVWVSLERAGEGGAPVVRTQQFSVLLRN